MLARISKAMANWPMIAVTAIFAFAVNSGDVTAREQACELQNLADYPDVAFVSATFLTKPVGHCRVEGIIRTETGFVLLLPDDWNGKFVMGGSGGFAGNYANAAQDLWNVVGSGWATVATDTGHKGNALSASWALNNLERQVNFGHMAVHRTAMHAKAIIKDYYGTPSRRDIFFGCSRGGGQGLMLAQRSPDLFDGIYAGAPAYSWTDEIAGRWTREAQLMYPNPDQITTPVIDARALQVLGNAVMARCDALDGLADGILNDPRQCDIDVSALECGTEGTNQCLTKEQVAVAEAVYGSLSYGNSEWPGVPYGAELPGNPLGWERWITGGFIPKEQVDFHPGLEDEVFEAPPVPNARWGFATGLMKYFFYSDPDWTYKDYDFSDYAHNAARLSPTLDATDPNLSEFRANGGKLIIDNGWMDGSLSAYGTIDYYENVLAFDKTARDDVRLFIRPGVAHCQGGPGPDGTNYIAALEIWLNTGVAPEKLDAPFVNPMTREPTGNGRIICAHPGTVTYDGSGDPNDPASFSCENFDLTRR
ncbi:DUF6351 family protein [Roseibium album]|uniref:Tannase and feruloyl esterase n=1 Tax=Roseibium album TaxID=311410 RepID=A0A0M6ZED0_9HYPH|nr:DUF6351 family protein [Roseibium album]CTQ61138.1 Tannase and feruloyl esterase [Roseibium album]CTQ63820.1 Tannase and feruloyl esterase [Roseibium album]CTQ72313.1 Tannase and feruloyl esterase [Roseibium album]